MGGELGSSAEEFWEVGGEGVGLVGGRKKIQPAKLTIIKTSARLKHPL